MSTFCTHLFNDLFIISRIALEHCLGQAHQPHRLGHMVEYMSYRHHRLMEVLLLEAVLVFLLVVYKLAAQLVECNLALLPAAVEVLHTEVFHHRRYCFRYPEAAVLPVWLSEPLWL